MSPLNNLDKKFKGSEMRMRGIPELAIAVALALPGIVWADSYAAASIKRGMSIGGSFGSYGISPWLNVAAYDSIWGTFLQVYGDLGTGFFSCSEGAGDWTDGLNVTPVQATLDLPASLVSSLSCQGAASSPISGDFTVICNPDGVEVNFVDSMSSNFLNGQFAHRYKESVYSKSASCSVMVNGQQFATTNAGFSGQMKLERFGSP